MMKNKAIFSTLLFVLLSSSPEFADQQVRASSSTLVQQGQQRQQGQQGLRPEQKQSLPAMGPDEIFPETTPGEVNKKANRDNRDNRDNRNSREPERPRP